jgi:hypothetical protein
VARVEADAPVEVEPFKRFRTGETTLAQTVQWMGPPDFFSFRWVEGEERVLRLEFIYRKARETGFSVSAPVDEISRYNTGVRFFLIFFNALRGKSVIPSELDSIAIDQAPGPGAAGSMARYSRIKPLHRGRPERFSSLPRRQLGKGSIEGRPLSPFVPLVVEGAGKGEGRIRLEFDAKGILVLKEIRSTAPGTGLADYVRETFLQ